MKPRSISILLPAFILHAGLSLSTLADTVTLKNGKIFQGTIVKETEDSLTIEVNEKGITDSITFRKTEIGSAVKSPKRPKVPKPPK